MADEIKIESAAPIGEPAFPPAPIAQSTGEAGGQPPAFANPVPSGGAPAPIDTGVRPQHTGSDLDYTQIGVQILLVAAACFVVYTLRYRYAQQKTALAKLQAQNDSLQAENKSLKASPLQQGAASGGMF